MNMKIEVPHVYKRDVVSFRKNILEWYSSFGRTYGWRTDSDPFHILVAEIMLQQTFADKVEPVFNEFIARYPSPEKVVSGRKTKMLEIFNPLGLLYRVDTIRRMSKTLANRFGGVVPENEIELMSLPGVGKYIASSVRSLAFDKHSPVVDGNIARIFSRAFFGSNHEVASKPTQSDWELAEILAPRGSTRDFNLALLDFGALVCKHYNPACSNCPVSRLCGQSDVTGPCYACNAKTTKADIS